MSEVFTVKGTVSLDSDEFHEAVDDVAKKGEQMAENIGRQSDSIQGFLKNAFSFSAGDLMSQAVQQAMQALKEFTMDSISIASDLQEVQNVVDVTFGDGAHQIEQWAASARTQYGLTELQAKQYTSTMGAMLKSMGMADTEVYSMSTAMAGLAADMASFYNLDFDEAFGKIRSGISGETEPLKQLGINLSVANLEAYALSKGITTAYESMTQAEQATLRYNYLMQATADAQGDFSRTSDSYANNLRTLEANIDSLKASFGEKLLPVLNEGISALNGLFNNEMSLSEAFAEAETAFEDNSASIVMNAAKANSLIDTLDRLSQKESLTEVEAAQWNAAVKELTAIYPSLTGMIGTNTGELNSSIEAIRNETNALKENALEKAKVAAMQAKINAWADATVKAGSMKIEYDMSYVEWRRLEDERAEILSQIGEVTNADQESIQALYEGYTLLEAGALGLDQSMVPLMDKYNALVLQCQDASASTAGLCAEWQAAEAQAASAETEVNALNEKLKELGVSAEEAVSEGGGTSGTFASVEEMTNNTLELSSVLEELLKEGQEVQNMFAELEQYKLDNFNSIAKNVEGVYGAFEKAGKVRGTSAKKMQSNMESQLEQLIRFQDAYDQLQEMGASDELMSNFTYSTESIAQMEALLKAGPEKLAETEETIASINTKQAEVAAAIAETQLNVDGEFAKMKTAAETAEAELNAKMAGLQEAANAMAATVVTDAGTAGEAVGTLQTAGEALGLSEWEPTINAEDNATSIINAIRSALDRLDGKTVTTYIKTVSSGDEDGSHATGLDRVPWDNYVARLHEGEAVLTRTEAENWRRGRNEKKAEQPITINVNVNGNANDPYAIADEVKTAMELMRWRA